MAPILRIDKLKASGARTPRTAMRHLTRDRYTPNAVPERREFNTWLIGSRDLDISREIDGRFALHGIVPRANAVIAQTVLMSMSPEAFRENADCLQRFGALAREFLLNQFEDRVIVAVLHLDEASPHVQAIILPLIAQGTKVRLCARDYTNRQRLIALQSAWEKCVRELGGGRRQRRASSDHIRPRTYYGLVEQASEIAQNLVFEFTLPARLSADGAERARQVEVWHEAQVSHVHEKIAPLVQLGVGMTLFKRERQKRRRTLDLLKKLRAEASALRADRAYFVDRRVPYRRIADLFELPIGEGADVLAQVCRAKQLSQKDALQSIAQNLGNDAALAVVMEAARQKIELRCVPSEDEILATWPVR